MNQYDYSNLATYTALSRIERETCNHGCINDNIETPDDTAALQ